jgi:hypothetical protein
VAKIYEFEFDAPPEQVYAQTLNAVGALGFSILRNEDGAASITFNTGPSIWSTAGQDMTATALAVSASSSKLVLTGQTARRGTEAQYGSWGERGRIAKGLAMWVLGSLAEPTASMPDTAPEALDGSAFVAELATLAELHESGALTDGEYADAKQRLLRH